MTEQDVNAIEIDCELSLEALEAVAGGLNPQPLPPLEIGRALGIGEEEKARNAMRPWIPSLRAAA